MNQQGHWIWAWIATAFTIGQIVLFLVLGAGDVAVLRYLGFSLWALAAVFGWLPTYHFKKRGGVARGDSYMETTQLVDTGLYAIVRHPQFVAWPLMNIAVALVSQHPLVIAVGAVAFVLAGVEFRKVDARNIAKFGDEYLDFMDRVPGWNFVSGWWRWVRRRLTRR